MPGNRQFNRYARAGQNIMDDVFRAVEIGEFAGLADSISRHISDAMADGARVRRGGNSYNGNHSYGNQAGSSTYGSQSQTGAYGSGAANAAAGQYQANYFLQKRVDTGKGRFQRAVGIALDLFTGIWGFLFIGAAIVFLLYSFPVSGLVCLGFAALNAFFFRKAYLYFKSGGNYIKMAQKYRQYGTMLAGREYFAISDLAHMANEDPQAARKNLMEMKKLGMIPQATFDAQYTTVMLTDRARAMYLDALKAQKQREGAAGQAQGAGRSAKGVNGAAKGFGTADEYADYDPNVREILQNGNDYIRQIREANDRIPDTDIMSDKLYRLEDIVRGIFDQVKKHPEKAGELRRMLNIYLPTTTKLLGAYEEYMANPYQTDQVKKTMKEILDAMDTICDGFEKLLAKMTEVDAMDISADIDVLNQMMEQDGLKESDNQMDFHAKSSGQQRTSQSGSGQQAKPDMATAQGRAARSASVQMAQTASGQASQDINRQQVNDEAGDGTGQPATFQTDGRQTDASQSNPLQFGSGEEDKNS